MLFIGQTRFSLFNPDSPSWRASNNSRFNTVSEYQEYLYADSRLDIRCEIFLNHSMPQLELAARDVELVHIVSYSDSLPEKYKAILAEGAERFPFLRLEERAHGRTILTAKDVAVAAMPSHGAFGVFRLDDDDLLPVDYFDQVSPYVTAANAGMQVSLAVGATALYEDGVYTNIRNPYWPMLAIGLLDVCHLNEDGSVKTPLPAPHHRSDRTNPVIVDGRGLGWLWVRHASQDTSLDLGGPANPDTLDRVVAQMAKYPEFTDSGHLARSFPLVKDRLLPATPAASAQ